MRCLLNHVGTLQLKACGNVTVKVSKVANKPSKSNRKMNIGQLSLELHRKFIFQGDSFHVTS